VLGAHGLFEIVQRSVAVLPEATVIVVVGEPAVVIEALPLTTLQAPVPTTAVLAAMVKVFTLHCSTLAGPASAVVGGCLTVMAAFAVISRSHRVVVFWAYTFMVVLAVSVLDVMTRLLPVPGVTALSGVLVASSRS
jgi:hypothetical protein